MSVDIEEFESRTGEDGAGWTNAERILAFLAEHDDEAWRPAAIAEETGVDPDSLGPTLIRLRDRGLVRHNSPYWAITDDLDRVREAIRHEEGPVDRLVELVEESIEELLTAAE